MKLQIADQEPKVEPTVTLRLIPGYHHNSVILEATNQDGLAQDILVVTSDGDIEITSWIAQAVGLNINEAGEINVLR